MQSFSRVQFLVGSTCDDVTMYASVAKSKVGLRSPLVQDRIREAGPCQSTMAVTAFPQDQRTKRQTYHWLHV